MQRYAKVCAEVCRGMQRCAEVCAEVCRGVCGGVQRYAEV